MKSNYIKPPTLYIFFIIFILLLFHSFNNYFILTKSRFRIGTDSQTYFSDTLRFLDILLKGKSLKSLCHSFKYVVDYDKIRPPLYLLAASPFVLLEKNINTATMVNLIYLAILLFATYGIGKNLYNWKIGLLSAFLISMFPTIFALSRIFQIELALTTMVALTFYLFVLNKFHKLNFSILTGIVIGLGALTKQQYFIFLLPILGYFFLQKDNLKDKRSIKNFFIALFIGLIISLPWYISHCRRNYLDYYYFFRWSDNRDPLFYIRSLFFRQLFPIYFSFLLVSFIFFIRKRSYYIPVTILVILLFFSISPAKEDRFILPIFPYIAVMIAVQVFLFTKIKRTLILGLILISFLQFFIICYKEILPLPKNNLFQRYLFQRYFSHSYDAPYGLFSIYKDNRNWWDPINKVIKALKDNTNKNTAEVLFITDALYMCEEEIKYQALLQEFNIHFINRFLFANKYNISDFELDVQEANDLTNKIDYVLLEKKYNNDAFSLIRPKKLLDYFQQNVNKFEYVDNIQFPNDLLLIVYKKRQ